MLKNEKNNRLKELFYYRKKLDFQGWMSKIIVNNKKVYKIKQIIISRK